MAYYLNCSDADVDCQFETRAETIEEVDEHCAEHVQREHGMMSFTPDLFAKMRRYVRVVDASSSASKAERP